MKQLIQGKQRRAARSESRCLLVCNGKAAPRMKQMVERASGERIKVSESLHDAFISLRNVDCKVVVFDHAFFYSTPDINELIWKNLHGAAPVFVNFALTSAERLARDIKAALARREQEQHNAIRSAEATLRGELTSAVAGILLSSELALAQPALPPAIASKLKSVHELALHMRDRLSSGA